MIWGKNHGIRGKTATNAVRNMTGEHIKENPDPLNKFDFPQHLFYFTPLRDENLDIFPTINQRC